MVERRNCLHEQNHFSCKDYARVNGDQDPMKEENVRQIRECNKKICSGEFYEIFSRAKYLL